MAVGVGRGARLLIGEDNAAWGAVGTPSIAFPLISESMSRKRMKTPRGVLHEGASGNVRDMFIEREEAGGTVEVLVTYEGWALLMRHIIWGTWSTSGAGPYTHDLLLGATPPTLGLTMELVKGSEAMGGSWYSEIYYGCRITKATFKVEVGGLLRASLEVIAKTASAPGTITSVAYTGSRDLIIEHYRAGTLAWNSLTWTLRSWELTISRSFERRYQLGSILTEDPAQSGHTEITLSVTREYRDNAAESGLHADTQSDAVFAFTTGTRSLTFTAHNAEITEAGRPISAVGVTLETVNFRALSDDTDQGLKVTVVNSQSGVNVEAA